MLNEAKTQEGDFGGLSMSELVAKQVKEGSLTQEEADDTLANMQKNDPKFNINAPIEDQMTNLKSLISIGEQERDKQLAIHKAWSNHPYTHIIESATKREEKEFKKFAEIKEEWHPPMAPLTPQEIGPLDEEKIDEFEAREDDASGDIPSSIPSKIFGGAVTAYGLNELAEGWKPGYKKIAKDWVGEKWNRSVQYTRTLFTDPKTIDFLLNDSEFNNILNEIDDLEKGIVIFKEATIFLIFWILRMKLKRLLLKLRDGQIQVPNILKRLSPVENLQRD